jgi:hypothetical protein
VLGIAFFIILIIGLVLFRQEVMVKFQQKHAELESAKITAETNIKTYAKKKDKLTAATDLNLALRDKLSQLGYLFLLDQESLIPFLETRLFPLIDSSPLGQGGGVIEADVYTFEINQLMNPFTTLPTHYFKDPSKVFPIKYFSEQNGKAPPGPRKTQPTTFLKSYMIKMSEFTGTYEEVKKFIKSVQQAKQGQLITIHCVMNDKGKNQRYYRTRSQWTIVMTVYFMNPEAAAVGDDPPDKPGSRTCG